MKNGHTLLLTGTIKPFVKVRHNDPEVRRAEYVEAISYYIKDTSFRNIVFAENSGYDFPEDEIRKLASENDKSFEMIRAVNADTDTNMSVGEAKLMRSALESSSILGSSDGIWKVTGRLKVLNANRILREQRGENVFLYSYPYDSLMTYFFRLRKEAMLKLFLSESAIGRMSGSCIEYAWIDIWRERHESIRLDRFCRFPDTVGVNSSKGKYTNSRLELFRKELLLRTGHYDPRMIPHERKQ